MDDYTLSQLGHYFGGEGLIIRGGEASATFAQTGTNASGSFTISQESTQPYRLVETGDMQNSIYRRIKTVSSAEHTLVESGTTAAGDSFTLTEEAVDTYLLSELGNRELGEVIRSRGGREDYTHSEVGSRAAGGFTETNIGNETYLITDSRDDGSGTFSRQANVIDGEYNRLAVGPGTTLPALSSGTYATRHRAIGNALRGDMFVEASNSRYELLDLFIDGSNAQVGTDPGSADRLPVGPLYASAVLGVTARIPPDYRPNEGEAGDIQASEADEAVREWFVSGGRLSGDFHTWAKKKLIISGEQFLKSPDLLVIGVQHELQVAARAQQRQYTFWEKLYEGKGLGKPSGGFWSSLTVVSLWNQLDLAVSAADAALAGDYQLAHDLSIKGLRENTFGKILIGGMAYVDYQEDYISYVLAGEYEKANMAQAAFVTGMAREMLPVDLYFTYAFNPNPIYGQQIIAMMDAVESLDPNASAKGRASGPFVGFAIDVAVTIATLPAGGIGAGWRGLRTSLSTGKSLLTRAVKSGVKMGRSLIDDAARLSDDAVRLVDDVVRVGDDAADVVKFADPEGAAIRARGGLSLNLVDDAVQPMTPGLRAHLEARGIEVPCFAAGTPLLTPDGHKAIEQIEPGDVVLARSEFDPDGPVEGKVVEKTFWRLGQVLHLHVGGKVIRTTPEHPFYVRDKGWIPGGDLEIGDLLSSHDGYWMPVEDLLDTGEYESVYNLRVADYHTYFVGSGAWGFSVWAHNQYGQTTQKIPSWPTAKRNYWKSLGGAELANPTGKFSATNIKRMLAGKPAQVRAEITLRSGKTVSKNISMELHHRTLPQRSGSALRNEPWNLEMTTPWGHQGMDVFRHTGYKLERIIKGTGTF